jgi:hypothetical protein
MNEETPEARISAIRDLGALLGSLNSSELPAWSADSLRQRLDYHRNYRNYFSPPENKDQQAGKSLGSAETKQSASNLGFLLSFLDKKHRENGSANAAQLISAIHNYYLRSLQEIEAKGEMSAATLMELSKLVCPLAIPSNAAPPYIDDQVKSLFNNAVQGIFNYFQQNQDSPDDISRSKPLISELSHFFSNLPRVSSLFSLSSQLILQFSEFLSQERSRMTALQQQRQTEWHETREKSKAEKQKMAAEKQRALAERKINYSVVNEGYSEESSQLNLDNSAANQTSNNPASSSTSNSAVPRASNFSKLSADSSEISSALDGVAAGAVVPPLSSLFSAVSAAKPKFLVLDGANIGRWSGSGDPSEEIVTVHYINSNNSNSGGQLGGELPNQRSLIRFESWQVYAAVLAVEKQLKIPALVCLPEQYIRKPERYAVRNVELLLFLQAEGKLHRLPAGADDDIQLITLAQHANTWLITNDNLRDHVAAQIISQAWVNQYVIKYYTINFPSLLQETAPSSAKQWNVASASDKEKQLEIINKLVIQRGSVHLVAPEALRRNIKAKKRPVSPTPESSFNERRGRNDPIMPLQQFPGPAHHYPPQFYPLQPFKHGGNINNFHGNNYSALYPNISLPPMYTQPKSSPPLLYPGHPAWLNQQQQQPVYSSSLPSYPPLPTAQSQSQSQLGYVRFVSGPFSAAENNRSHAANPNNRSSQPSADSNEIILENLD